MMREIRVKLCDVKPFTALFTQRSAAWQATLQLGYGTTSGRLSLILEIIKLKVEAYSLHVRRQ